MSAGHRVSFLSAALAAAALTALPLPGFAQTVSEVSITSRAPTQVTISLAGKSAADVSSEVKVAARIVCRNAVSNHELDRPDLNWCRRKSAAKAMDRYALIAAGRTNLAAAPSLVLSLR